MKNIIPFTRAEEKAIEKIVERRDKVEARFPLFAGILAAFGLVSTYYGFEKLIDRIELFERNPWILLATGILTLLVTGAAYRKLN